MFDLSYKKSEVETNYKNLQCEDSLFIFNKKNKLRRFIYKASVNPYFVVYLNSIIVISLLKLAIDSYIPTSYKLPEDYTLSKIILLMKVIDYYILASFIMEVTFKIVALGMWFEDDSYLAENWNKLDFIIVLSNVLTLLFPVLNLDWTKVLRVLRVLRILRNDNSNVNMKILVITFMDSLIQIVKIVFIIFVVFLVISIFGVSILKDSF